VPDKDGRFVYRRKRHSVPGSPATRKQPGTPKFHRPKQPVILGGFEGEWVPLDKDPDQRGRYERLRRELTEYSVQREKTMGQHHSTAPGGLARDSPKLTAHATGRLLTWVVTLAALLLGFPACGGGDGGGGGNDDGELPDVRVVGEDQEPADRSDVSYEDNILAKVESGEWTLGEGLIATLQLFVGEGDAASVLRHTELLTHEGTGTFRMAEEYLEDGTDAGAQGEISRLLDRLRFSVEELEEMAGLGPKSGLITTKGSLENCLEFFREYTSLPPGVGVCLEQESAMIDGKLYRIFFPAGSLPSAGWTEAHVALVLEAMRDAVPKYNALGKMPAVALVFAAAQGGGLWGESFPQPEKTCGISIYTALQHNSADRFKQLIAHELAHCFQAETHPGQHSVRHATMAWHFEGLAEYWSNVVYPEVNLEWGFLPKLEEIELKTSVILGRTYENFLFFQYLGSNIGDEAILRLVGSLPTDPAGNLLDQQEALADYQGMAQTYHEFVKAVTDGRVKDTSQALIPFEARSVAVDLYGKATPYVRVPRVKPFGVVRILIGVDETKHASLAFDGKGPVTESTGPASDGVSAGIAGLVVESVRDPAGRNWMHGVPSEIPEEECNTRKIILVTTSTEPDAAFDLAVPDFDDVNDCCLHGRWMVNNDDIAELWTAGIGRPVSVSGQFSATFGTDGHVEFLWAGYMSAYDGQPPYTDAPYTATLNGGGTQSYSTRNGNELTYGGPELTPLQGETGPFNQTVDPYPVALDAWYGDVETSHLYECESDTLTMFIPGPGKVFDIHWSPL